MPSLIAPDGLTPGTDEVDLERVKSGYSQAWGGRFEPIGARFHDSSAEVAARTDFVSGVATALHARRSLEAE